MVLRYDDIVAKRVGKVGENAMKSGVGDMVIDEAVGLAYPSCCSKSSRKSCQTRGTTINWSRCK
jgi:hypothetical protein